MTGWSHQGSSWECAVRTNMQVPALPWWLTQTVKVNPPAVWETWVRSLAREEPLEGGGMATHSSILVWRTPMDRGAWRATGPSVPGSQTTKHTARQAQGRGDSPKLPKRKEGKREKNSLQPGEWDSME